MPRCLSIFPVFLFCCVVASAPARAETQPGSPEHAVRMVYEGGHSLNYAMMAEHACMTEQERAELKAFFAAQIQELRAAGVDFDAISYDFSHLKYMLVDRTATWPGSASKGRMPLSDLAGRIGIRTLTWSLHSVWTGSGRCAATRPVRACRWRNTGPGWRIPRPWRAALRLPGLPRWR